MAANVWRDVRLAVRSYSKRPGFASSTLLIAALGLGATTSIFSVVDAVMLRDLGYPQEAQTGLLRPRIPSRCEIP